jgi:hypothetical protein
MNTLQKRILAALAALFAAALAAYWYWSPYLAVRELREAAIAADATRFNERVDFPKLRASLKDQFSARLDKGESADAGAALGGLFARALVDKMIDVAIRPETIMFAMREGKFKIESGAPREGEGDQGSGERKKVVWRTERQGFDTVLFHAEGDGNGASKEKMALVMQREGFASWKLTDIRLPD